MKTKIKDGNLNKEYKCTCSFCGCEFKYTPNDITFSETGALYVSCPDCILPNPPVPQEKTIASPVAISPDMMQAILGNGKSGGLMI